jgi:hypothetical protein
MILGVLYALAKAKNTLWARPCLSVCRFFQPKRYYQLQEIKKYYCALGSNGIISMPNFMKIRSTVLVTAYGLTKNTRRSQEAHFCNFVVNAPKKKLSNWETLLCNDTKWVSLLFRWISNTLANASNENCVFLLKMYHVPIFRQWATFKNFDITFV